ncbi:hypothetical protein QJS10_CPB18g01992 [Acorus calamus]|uniref:Uncharacterized protein n=1 Tax=Acorus calamus TaxID=4465 RepID=A0AAV9CP59_ACOCL|nr:hypothetical protein QJS10_CPB18g01992 [Acorus calamus]
MWSLTQLLKNGGAVTVQKSMKSGWYDLLQNWNLVKVQKSSRSAWCQTEDIKEPYVSSSFRNLLHFFPGFVSADEDDNRIFFSDTNHHRIIVTNGDGRILDCIGSSPGFEDGDFKSAKLLRPTASFYDDAENCLYFVDSENHAIRRADMERRVLETIYPTCSEKGGGIGYWILDKFGMERQIDLKPGESSANSLSFPWHLIKSESNDLLVINRRFDTLWILNMGSGEVKEVYKGFSSIMEMCGQIIMEKVAPVKAFPEELKQRLDHRYSVNGFPYAGLVSSIASLQNSVVFCDTAGLVVLKRHNESKEVSLLRLSNFEVLGFPYWCACPLEGTSVRGAMNGAWRTDLLQQFSVMPGRCDIRLNVHIPEGTELVEPLKEGCIWHQARGSAAVVSGSEDMGSSAEKVGVAQQWFDELDNLAFSQSSIENETKFQERNSQTDKTVHIDCAVNISPGTSEVVVSAVLYLKLTESESSIVNDEYSKTLERMLDLLKNKGIRNPEKEACLQIVAESFRDIGGLIFLKPLHLRIRLNVLDRPTTERSNEAISDQSSLEVNVSLD